MVVPHRRLGPQPRCLPRHEGPFSRRKGGTGDRDGFCGCPPGWRSSAAGGRSLCRTHGRPLDRHSETTDRNRRPQRLAPLNVARRDRSHRLCRGTTVAPGIPAVTRDRDRRTGISHFHGDRVSHLQGEHRHRRSRVRDPGRRGARRPRTPRPGASVRLRRRAERHQAGPGDRRGCAADRAHRGGGRGSLNGQRGRPYRAPRLHGHRPRHQRPHGGDRDRVAHRRAAAGRNRHGHHLLQPARSQPRQLFQRPPRLHLGGGRPTAADPSGAAGGYGARRYPDLGGVQHHRLGSTRMGR